MGKADEIRGYRWKDGTIVCTKCVTDEERKDLKEDEILTDHDVDDEDEMYFCDRCKKGL